nr:MAG: hypothetical protein A2V48_04925 [Candidatus Amesbacteria bacterium RBG_19FT_COMBO_48_16]
MGRVEAEMQRALDQLTDEIQHANSVAELLLDAHKSQGFWGRIFRREAKGHQLLVRLLSEKGHENLAAEVEEKHNYAAVARTFLEISRGKMQIIEVPKR